MPNCPAPDRSQYWRSEALGGVELRRTHLLRRRFSPHLHDTLMIGLIREGRKRFDREGRAHVAAPGMISVVNPGEWHTGMPEAGEALVYDALYPARLLAGRPEAEPRFRSAVIDDPVVFRRLARALAVRNGTRLEQEEAFRAGFELLARRHGESAVPPVDPKVDANVGRARELLRARFATDLGVEALALACDVSPGHLMRSFRQQLGAPIHVFQTQLRISEACRLLRAGLPIVEVALRVGYADQAHFSKRFKALMGTSPGSYSLAWRS